MKAWVAHINEQHSFQWFCPLHRSTGAEASSFTFQKKEDMEEHIKNSHNNLSASQIRIIIRRSARPGISPMFQSCPFCEFLPEGITKGEVKSTEHVSAMQGHIANHLLSLAIMSLPWRDDVVEAEDKTDDGIRSFSSSEHITIDAHGTHSALIFRRL
jgi:hypothetical protein